jgi:hypothetical protein
MLLVGRTTMSRQGIAFDYGSPAELYLSRRGGRHTDYRRFTTAAEAIRYAFEELRTRRSLSAWMEVGDEVYNKSEIKRLYYPLSKSLSPAPVKRLGAIILGLEKLRCLKRFRRENRFRVRPAHSEYPISTHGIRWTPSITLYARPLSRLRRVGTTAEEQFSRLWGCSF